MSAQFEKAGESWIGGWVRLACSNRNSQWRPSHLANKESPSEALQYAFTVNIVQSLPKDGPVKPSQAQQLEVSISMMRLQLSGKDAVPISVMRRQLHA